MVIDSVSRKMSSAKVTGSSFQSNLRYEMRQTGSDRHSRYLEQEQDAGY